MTSVGARDWARTDFYAVLGLDPTASAAEVDLAYRRLAKELHPDRNPDLVGAADRFAAVVRAKEILGDPSTRRAYDASRVEAGRTAGTTAPVGDRLATPPSRPSRPPMARGPRLGIAAALLALGLAMAVWATVGHLRAGAAERGTLTARGAIAEVDGSRRVVFRTAAGERRSAPLSERVAGAPGKPITVRYRPADPAGAVVVQSRLLADLTIGIAAAKLLVGGAVVLAYPSLRARFTRPRAGLR